MGWFEYAFTIALALIGFGGIAVALRMARSRLDNLPRNQIGR